MKSSNTWYQEYLASEHWKFVQEWHYQKKANRSCKICETQTKLQIHHRTYKLDGKSVLYHEHELESPGVLVTLCYRCHSFWHLGNKDIIFKKKFLYRIRNLIKAGVSVAEAITICSGSRWEKNKHLLEEKTKLKRESDKLKAMFKSLKKRV